LANEEVVGVVAVIQDLKSVGKFIYTLTGHEDYGLDNILGDSESINMLKQQVQRVARSNSTVLIRGESGTGKELFARAIHAESERSKGPFIGINCAAIPETLLESELFGYEEGSFTGAKKGGKLGKFELAQQGTLFLDEIGDIPLHLQVKLLRVLEERSFERIGGISPVKLEARLITATNRDLESMVKRGEFREDLYYRLNVIPIFIPPLRERKEDIIPLIQDISKKINERYGMNKTFTNSEIEVMLKYDWPGNVRELENIIERVMVTEDGGLSLLQTMVGMKNPAADAKSYKEKLEEYDKMILLESIKQEGSVLKAAEKLGINATTIRRKLHKYKVQKALWNEK